MTWNIYASDVQRNVFVFQDYEDDFDDGDSSEEDPEPEPDKKTSKQPVRVRS